MDHKSAAIYVVKTLKEAGHIAYFAGGWVRDFIMKHPSDDIDIATSAGVEEIQTLFPKTIPVGVSFGIVIVVIESHQFEVATFRKDRGYIDGRRPTGIDPASPEIDAKRRISPSMDFFMIRSKIKSTTLLEAWMIFVRESLEQSVIR
jgi:poly(A) polymerase